MIILENNDQIKEKLKSAVDDPILLIESGVTLGQLSSSPSLKKEKALFKITQQQDAFSSAPIACLRSFT